VSLIDGYLKRATKARLGRQTDEASGGTFLGVKWLSILGVLLAMSAGFASVFVIGDGRTERSTTAKEAASSLAKRWSAGTGQNASATCRPARKAGHFDCRLRLWERARRRDEAALTLYDWSDVTVPAHAP
jgi:hypothetical protein